jgi:hypothetical protein
MHSEENALSTCSIGDSIRTPGFRDPAANDLSSIAPLGAGWRDFRASLGTSLAYGMITA